MFLKENNEFSYEMQIFLIQNMNKKLWFLFARALLYHREHGLIIQPNTRAEPMLKLKNVEEENFDKEEQSRV